MAKTTRLNLFCPHCKTKVNVGYQHVRPSIDGDLCAGCPSCNGDISLEADNDPFLRTGFEWLFPLLFVGVVFGLVLSCFLV